jgi:hypothetical protein
MTVGTPDGSAGSLELIPSLEDFPMEEGVSNEVFSCCDSAVPRSAISKGN